MQVLRLTPKIRGAEQNFESPIGCLFDNTYWWAWQFSQGGVGMFRDIVVQVIRHDDICQAGYQAYYDQTRDLEKRVNRYGHTFFYSHGGRSITIHAIDVVCGWFELFVEYENDSDLIHFMLLGSGT